jgi:hypothetical protein
MNTAATRPSTPQRHTMLQNYFSPLPAPCRPLGAAAANLIGLEVGIAVSTLLLLSARSGPAMNDVFPNAGRIPRIDRRHAHPSSSRATGPLGE